MLTLIEMETLHRLAEWIVPPDETETEGGNAAIPYLIREIGTGAAGAFLPDLRDFLAKLHRAHFLSLPPVAQDRFLRAHVGEPAFQRLAELINEGFYTSPAGMAMIGFTPVRMELL